MNRNISWEQFAVCNPDVRTAFEKMCRLLFNRYFFDNNAILHSNPNNPGVEVVPILEPKSNKYISFQSKYFDSETDYSQIKHSVEMTIKYYSGKLNTLYLYSNKDVNTNCDSYKNIEKLLNEVEIEFIPINNQTVLDQVIEYPVVVAYYFNHHGLTDEWFQERLKISLASLGSRYSLFNVSTNIEENIDLFSKNVEAIARINQKKDKVIEEIKKNRWSYQGYNDFVEEICNAIGKLKNVEHEDILSCLTWVDIIRDICSDKIKTLTKNLEKKENEPKDVTNGSSKKKRDEIQKEIMGLKYFIDCPSLLEINETEKGLLQRKILVVQGKAGTGKSQLFANAAEKSIKSGGHALLLLGHTYLTDDPIMQQTLSHFELDFSSDDFLNILEGIGEEQNQCIVIYIDAINESGNKDIWKTGMHNLFSKVEKLNHVRVAISVRTGYEPLVFDETVQEKLRNREIAELVHDGFQDNSVKAIKAFLNHYNIQFSPYYLLRSELSNPLFLTLFCKIYTKDDGEIDIFTLFEKVIDKIDKEAQQAVELDGSMYILKHLMDQIACFQLSSNKKHLEVYELLALPFWETYGIIDTNKIKFKQSLERSGLLISSISNNIEVYSLGYNLLDDFVCAKFIIGKYSDKETLKKYLQDELLQIENGKIVRYSNQDIFIVASSLYAEKFTEECIDIIDSINDEFDKCSIAEKYVESFLWRKSKSINSDSFVDFINHYHLDCNIAWRVLIENSTKTTSPLNADLLHSILKDKSISQRDYIWTIYINDLASEEKRIFQLVDFFDKGNSLSGLTDENIILLLVLFSWLLTSSNRLLRDKTSKAMIEILKTNFKLCKPLLGLFKDINDPYVIQRLYGVVFGSTMKRTLKYEPEFKELSEYIFKTIFNQDTVYPDILLRDYARLIIERCLHEFPETENIIAVAKIRPPYRSVAIPVVEEEYYQDDVKGSGFNRIDFSMRPEGFGIMYGDFGRYTFQSALSDFMGIDIKNLYHYAMQYIRDKLGYDDKLFGDYDYFRASYSVSRHDTKKIERIGKKYQWIAMYNILARVSDTCKPGKPWEDELHLFQGAWEPYVRDFDPTLNCNFLTSPDLPQFNFTNEQSCEFLNNSHAEKSEIEDWAGKPCAFFSSHDSKLILKDTSGQTWIRLSHFEKIENDKKELEKYSIGLGKGYQELWSKSHSYIVKQDDFEIFKKDLEKKNFMGRWFPEASEVYQLFNREYTWSPGCHSIFKNPWINYEVKVEEKRIKVIGQMMPAYSEFRWEGEYDASQEETTAFCIPCKDILEHLKLEQKKYDGYFYDQDNILIAFDGDLAKICNGLLIRKDYLDKYLNENNLRLFWTCLGEKQYFLGDMKQVWSEWSGFFYIDGDDIIGTMKNIKTQSSG